MNPITTLAAAAALAFAAAPATAEILAMANYESKTPDQVKSLKLSGDAPRREGIAIFDVDPESPNFGRILADIPLDPSGVAHHIFYDRTMTKAYVTSLGAPALQVMDMTRFPPRLATIEVPNCTMAEDVIFDEANEHWYLTCLSSQNVRQGKVATDEVTGEIALPGTHPHGLAIDSKIDRILVTDTVTPDMATPGNHVSVVRASTLEPLGQVAMANGGDPVGPVEILPVPGTAVPTFYVTNLHGASLSALTWNPATEAFEASDVFDFKALGMGVALEMYFNSAGDRLYVTTAVPGHLHIFDMTQGGPLAPKPVATIPAGEGAHHVAITKDERYAFVQNALLNLPGMSDGSITVVDLGSGEVVASFDTLKEMGLNPNSLVLLPDWNHLAGH
ncbi:hypothetical protein M1105_15680 [Limibaculum sp. FT325]|uniref:YncE family protein n=1 Tax=Thermohalobaculum sediminis TaxID=2939436 RepID=UPI0020BFB53D|nr:hypothetical protein [Limibaculum sediminis]MCL5778420.1 hypothetical protein [Limibaculum sediminis]